MCVINKRRNINIYINKKYIYTYININEKKNNKTD